MKKLYFIHNARIPTQRAHGLQTMHMCEAFVRAGFEVELIVPNRFNELPDDPFDFYGIARNFSIKKLFTIDIAPHREPAHPIFYWIQSLTFGLALFWYLLPKKNDYIYFRFDVALLPLLFLLRKRNTTTEVHFLAEGWRRKFLFFSHNIIVINRRAKELYDQDLGSGEKTLIAPDGVSVGDFSTDVSKFDAREKLHLPQDKKLAVYTGYFYPWKGVDILVYATKLLPPDTEVIMVGGSEHDTAPLLHIVHELKISNIRFVPFRPHHEMVFYQKAADCLVLIGSNRHQESKFFTSPLKLFEYMASGRPIVASHTPAIAEILHDGDSALLADPDNAEELARGITKVLSDENLAHRIADAARRDVEQYDWVLRARHIKDFIEARALKTKAENPAL